MTFGLFESHSLGARVKAMREYRGFSQKKLGEKIGVSQSAIAQVESGETKMIKGNTLLRMAAALEANPRWIMSGKGEPLGMDETVDGNELLALYESMSDEHKAALVAAARAFAGK